MEPIANAVDQTLQKLRLAPTIPNGSSGERLSPTTGQRVRPLSEMTDKDQIQRSWPDKPRLLSKIRPDVWGMICDLADKKHPWPLYLWSRRPGTGKTCAGLSVCDVAGANSRGMMFDEFAGEFFDIKTGKIGGSVTGFWETMKAYQFLFIDDIGIRKTANDTQYEALKGVLDRREGKALMLTSNLSPEEIGQVFDARVMDRLIGGTVMEIPGESLR